MKKQTFTPDEDFNVEMAEFVQWLDQSKSSTQHMNTIDDLIDRLQLEIDCLKDGIDRYALICDELQGEIEELVQVNRGLATQVLDLKSQIYDLLR